MKRLVSAFAAGLLFGSGLLLSGMADPARVLGFFDLFGVWDPTLALVMAGGLTVTALGYRWCLRRSGPLCAVQYQIPANQSLDARLFVGSALFGLGWGLVGYCPGPAILSAGGGVSQALWFCLAMAAGMLVWRALEYAEMPQGRVAQRG